MSRRVPLVDLRRDHTLDCALVATFRRVLESGQYVLGPDVESFERACSAYLGAKHAIGLSSGTDALMAALMALDVGPGDEVICPSFTFFATAGVIARLGAKPVFVDCSLDHYGVRVADVDARFGPKTKAILVAHLFGRVVELADIRDLARARSVPIVEDAAQAFGAALADRKAGTTGAMGCFSFFSTKNLGALGDAGLLTTDDDALATKVRLLRAHGASPKYHHAIVGGNFRLDALQAALLEVKLPYLERAIESRRANARRYIELLHAHDGRELVLPAMTPDHSFSQFVVRVLGEGKREALRDHLQHRGVSTEVYYPAPMHLQPCFRALGQHEGTLPNAERAAREALALPNFPGLSDDDISWVAASVTEHFAC